MLVKLPGSLVITAQHLIQNVDTKREKPSGYASPIQRYLLSLATEKPMTNVISEIFYSTRR